MAVAFAADWSLGPVRWIGCIGLDAFDSRTVRVSLHDVYSPALDAGNLPGKFDGLIFGDDALQGAAGAPRNGVPDEYRDRIGAITTTRTVPQLKTFVEGGGVILAIGHATGLGFRTGLPIADALVENGVSGVEQPLPSTKFYVPGSILQARVDPANPIAYGLDQRIDFFFDQSPAFRIAANAG